MSLTPSLDRYKLEVEILSPTCIGGVDNLSGNDETRYHSYEYFISGDSIYFISENDIMNLLKLGIIDDEDLELEYEELVNRIVENKKAKDYLKSAKLSKKLENRIELYRFSKSVVIEEGIKEIPTIFGSTIKGVLRTGYIASKDIYIKYDFERDKNKRLKLKYDNNIYDIVFKRNDYELGFIDLQKKGSENLKDNSGNLVNLIFKNIICSDLRLTEGYMVIEKISRVHRKSKNGKRKGIPQYFETPCVNSKFAGEIKYKYYDKKNTPLSLFTCLCKNSEAITPVEECFLGLKKLSDKIINAEKKIMNSIAGQNMDYFYDKLKEENKKEYQLMFKLGYSGILSKSFMAMDESNLNNDAFLPYTINVVEETKLPTGWVKVKWELE